MSQRTPVGRVLLVEDDAGIREALGEVLVDLGYEVVSAPDGWHGLELASKQPEPCAILLDWRMPVLDGPQFLSQLRQLPRGKEFPVILSTAEPSATVAAMGDQVAGVLSKPFELRDLVAVLCRVRSSRPG